VSLPVLVALLSLACAPASPTEVAPPRPALAATIPAVASPNPATVTLRVPGGFEPL
jgi:hypothetical protein